MQRGNDSNGRPYQRKNVSTAPKRTPTNHPAFFGTTATRQISSKDRISKTSRGTSIEVKSRFCSVESLKEVSKK